MEEKQKKIKLAFYGDAPVVATGFGKVSSNILPPLYKTGMYDIEVFGVNYLGDPHNYPFKIYPMIINNQKDPYGRQKFREMIVNVDFDILFLLQDSFILQEIIPEALNELKKRGKRFKSLVYFPVDGVPKAEWIKAMSSADQPVTYTEWGKKQCINVCPEIAPKLDAVPHGINTDEFFPLASDVRKALRQKYFVHHANKFIIINVNRNQPRKDIPRSLQVFKMFQKEVCQDSVYYLHMAAHDFGWNLLEVLKTLDLELGKDVLLPANFSVNQGFPVSIVNELYNCADVCISTTLGEGWGLSSVEAMCTKTPCVFPDNTSLTEIFSDGRGLLAKSGEHVGMTVVLSNDNEVVRPLTNPRDMVKLMKKVYEKPEFAQRMTERAYTWVHKTLRWEKHIVPRFHQHIQRLYAELQNETSITEAPKPEKQAPTTDWKVGEII